MRIDWTQGPYNQPNGRFDVRNWACAVVVVTTVTVIPVVCEYKDTVSVVCEYKDVVEVEQTI